MYLSASICACVRLVGLHSPVDHVDPVSEEVGHGAAAEIPEPAPKIKFFFAERLIGSATEPLLPVESLGVHRLVIADPGEIVLPPVGADLWDAAEAAALDQVDGVAEVAPTALLHAALENLFAGADGLGERGAFFERVGDRFFKVDVFAGGDGRDGHANVPVVGRGNEDGVEFLV